MIIENKLSPQDCAGMSDIRAEIDMLDEHIIKLIAQRFAYVKAAAKFKTSPMRCVPKSASRPCCNNEEPGPTSRA